MGSSTRLSNTLQFPSIAPGASVSMVHDLVIASKKVIPDKITLDTDGEFDVVADNVTVTLTNVGQLAAAPKVLAEYYNSDDRAFGSAAETNLSIKPFVVGGKKDKGTPSNSPAFTSPPVEHTIYARLTGNDVSGKGTLAKPYRTFARAIQDVPTEIAGGVFYTVDITGIGTENLPDDYGLTPFASTYALEFDFSDPWSTWKTAVKIRAVPQLTVLSPPSAATINPGDVASMVADPDTGLVRINLTAPRASWGGNALKGKLFSASGGVFDIGVVAKSDTTFIELASPTIPTLPGQINDRSAALVANNFGFQVNSASSVQFVGIDIPFLYASNIASLSFYACSLTFAEIDGSGGVNFFPIINNYWNNGYMFISAQVSMPNCFFDGMFGMQLTPPSTFAAFRWCVVDGCAPIENAAAVGGGPGGAMGMLYIHNSEIRGSSGDGVIFHGNVGKIAQTRIKNCAGNGITCNLGAGVLQLDGVVGSGNTGLGVSVDDGMQVKATGAPTTVTGAGGDFKVGSLAVGAWGAPQNVPDFTGASATGSRLSQS